MCIYAYRIRIRIHIRVRLSGKKQAPSWRSRRSARTPSALQVAFMHSFSNVPKGNGLRAMGSKNPRAY